MFSRKRDGLARTPINPSTYEKALSAVRRSRTKNQSTLSIGLGGKGKKKSVSMKVDQKVGATHRLLSNCRGNEYTDDTCNNGVLHSELSQAVVSAR